MFKVAKKLIYTISLIFSFMYGQITPMTEQQTLPVDQKSINLTDCPITPSADPSPNQSMQNTQRIFNMGSLLNMIRDSKGALDFQRLSKRDEIIIALGELVKNNFFPKDFDGNLMIDPNAYSDQESILQLIEFLEINKNKPASTELLDLFNEFYHIWLYQFIISDILISKDLSVSLNTYYDELYNKKIKTQKGNILFPFRTTLSKIMIYILIINGNNDSYRVKQQNLVYLLNIIKNELIDINDKLKDPIVEQNIIELIKTLQTYTINIPVIQPKNVRRWIIGGTVIVSAAVLTYVLMQEPVQDYIKDKYNNAKTEVNDWIKDIVRVFGKELTNGILENEEFKKAIKEGVQEATASVIDGIAYGHPDKKDPNTPDDGSDQNNPKKPNPALQVIKKEVIPGYKTLDKIDGAWDKTKQWSSNAWTKTQNWWSRPKKQEPANAQVPTTTKQ